MRTRIAARGFTLLELVVVMAIMVVIGAAATATFGQAVDNRDRVGERAAALAELQRANMFMQRDFEQVVARGARDELGDAQPFLMSNGEGGVELTRTGWLNPLDTRPRSTLQRVRYRFEDGRIWRDYWEHPDRQTGSEPVSAVLMNDVLGFRVQFLHRPEGSEGKPAGDYSWQEQWPLADDSRRDPAFQRAPLAVSVEIESRRFGTMKRFFRIVANPHARET
ncbi:MAG: type II secretion system minor pseudopilin GspJ [Pseudomonadota bacterium]